ncbi:hypothetical protein FB45DRAFT_913702 [Roridomyces roridus]|uniref:Uncharacterized protein n=1 Tax=Roridomyces roridus TaxID=1738132 RepID=A0AAD7BWW6_9AGAR|nr:hypothetical protein FB45DRAFT_913702 [Roridomyces roridus]
MTRTPVSIRQPTSILKSTQRPLDAPKTVQRMKRTLFSRSRADSFENIPSDDERQTTYLNASPIPSPQKGRPSYSWDDEKTLVSSLLHESLPNDPKHDPALLADKLRSPFSQAGKHVVQDVVHVLQPAMQRVSTVHDEFDHRLERSYETGLLTFDDACKVHEALSGDEQAALSTAYEATEARIKDLFERLKDAYAHRAQLWKDVEAFLTQTVDPALQVLAEVPAATERTIASLEKHAKTLAAKDTDDGAEKIRGMFAKLS